jgi:hypothetical protein
MQRGVDTDAATSKPKVMTACWIDDKDGGGALRLKIS